MKKRMVALLLITILSFATVATGTAQGPATSTDLTWHPDNMACVMGLSLRDDLGLSDKWYNIVPVDLTVEGTQRVDMVVSSQYYFGSAIITVADGEVTVDYELPKVDAYVKDECLQWFTSLDEVTEDFLANPVGAYAFGEPVSISEQLNGQSVALLFICNRVTYAQPNNGEGLTRYYPNLDQWKSWRESLMELLEAMEAERAEQVVEEITETVQDEVATDTDLNVATSTDL